MPIPDHRRAVAVRLLEYYLRRAWEAAGLEWQPVNSLEVEGLVDVLAGRFPVTLPVEVREALEGPEGSTEPL